jgi:hypothetical protein
MAFSSLVAIYGYLGDTTKFNSVINYYKQGIGGPDPGYTWGRLDWQADAANPRIINAAGAVKQGLNIDGVQPEEMRSGNPSFTTNPQPSNYNWGALQGHVMGARIAERIGYAIWDHSSNAI